MNDLCEFRLALSPTLQAVEQFCCDFRKWSSAHCASADTFAIELLLRELLTNALVHGNLTVSKPRIFCILRVGPRRVLIVVRDQGPGFDWRASWNKQAQLQETGGRGVEIMRRYATRVHFNQEGNTVILLKRLQWREHSYCERR